MDGTASAGTNGSVTAEYLETDVERLVRFTYGDRCAVIAQNRDGYAMLKVRTDVDGDELERYYGFDMALDHVAELLGVRHGDIPVPHDATDMGM